MDFVYKAVAPFIGFFLLLLLYIIFDVARERKQKNKQQDK